MLLTASSYYSNFMSYNLVTTTYTARKNLILLTNQQLDSFSESLKLFWLKKKNITKISKPNQLISKFFFAPGCAREVHFHNSCISNSCISNSCISNSCISNNCISNSLFSNSTYYIFTFYSQKNNFKQFFWTVITQQLTLPSLQLFFSETLSKLNKMSKVFKTALIKVVFYCSQYIVDASIIFFIWLFILNSLLTCYWNFFDIWKSLKIAFKRKDKIQKSFGAQFFFSNPKLKILPNQKLVLTK